LLLLWRRMLLQVLRLVLWLLLWRLSKRQICATAATE